MKQLTIAQAIEQGYEKWVYAGEGFQSLNFLSDIQDSDFQNGIILLVEKEPYQPSGISAEDLLELIGEHLNENHSSESGDDTDEVLNNIKKIDHKVLEPLIKAIDDKLDGLCYYHKATDVELLPNESTKDDKVLILAKSIGKEHNLYLMKDTASNSEWTHDINKALQISRIDACRKIKKSSFDLKIIEMDKTK